MNPRPGGDVYVFPAPAGINRDLDCSMGKPQGVPRASGDKPQPRDVPGVRGVCSPRQRG
ncbi:hypothetical protein H5V55_001367 [Salmonella enterica]|nr:hypothetical protein [Salmonella enterica]